MSETRRLSNPKGFRQYLDKYRVTDEMFHRGDYDYYGAYLEQVEPIRWRDLPEKARQEDLRQISEGLRPTIPEDAYMWPDKFKTSKHSIPPVNRNLWNIAEWLKELFVRGRQGE